MASTINADDGVISGIAGVKTTADSTGALNIQTNGTTAITISAAQAVSLTNSPTFTGGTANGVLYLNGSKVATSGSALVFDGTNLGLSCTPSSFANFTYLSINGTTGSILNLRSNNTTQFEINTTGTLNNFSSITTLPFVWSINSAEQMRLTSTGLGIGTTTPGQKLEVAGNIFVNTSGNPYAEIKTSGSGNNPSLKLTADTNSWVFQGTFSSAYDDLQVLYNATKIFGVNNLGNFEFASTTTSNGHIAFTNSADGGTQGYIGDAKSLISGAANSTLGVRGESGILFGIGATERARITSAGEFVVGKTTAAIGTAGFYVTAAGETVCTVNGNPVFYVNRLTSDGELVRFYQDTTQEGSISVSGNTVSYNAFAGSHWSQLQDGSKPDILRGTVMESINELCVWPDEQNERLPKSKVSDTAGSKKVYGVFMAWDNDWATTNDMYVTAVGAFICRVNGSVTVQEGDLLESNGDGTACVQADDIVRSSTIGKVTSTVKTHQYGDGSYCVPTVLYCG